MPLTTPCSPPSLATLDGHTNTVWSAAFSPNGQRVVTASFDGTARLWDAADGALLATFKGHTGEVYSAAFSPDGRRVVTASDDETARLWDAADGALLAILAGHTGAVNRAAFSPDGTRVATASGDNTVRLWDTAEGALLTTLGGHMGAVNSVAFSPDGRRVVTASADATARLWDAADGTLRATLEHQGSRVYGVAFSPDGQQVATASEGGAGLWDVMEGTLLVAFEDPGRVLSAAFSPDGTRALTASSDNMARLWRTWPLLRGDTATYVAIAALRALTPDERSRAFLPASVAGTAQMTPEPDGHRQLAESLERTVGSPPELERALFHYAVAVRLYEEEGREEEAAPCRMRRGSLARVLPPEVVVRIAYKAMDWRPSDPPDG
jgi:dipeptidyl aminopeptidase/acylaminoacyl peptidase